MGTARAANPNWLKIYPKWYEAVLIHKSREKEEEREDVRSFGVRLPKSLFRVLEPCFPEMAEHLSAIGNREQVPCFALLACMQLLLCILICLCLNPWLFPLYPSGSLPHATSGAGAGSCTRLSWWVMFNHSIISHTVAKLSSIHTVFSVPERIFKYLPFSAHTWTPTSRISGKELPAVLLQAKDGFRAVPGRRSRWHYRYDSLSLKLLLKLN